jgi:hypothetical protein
VERFELAELFAGQTEACDPAREALLAGGDFTIWDGASLATSPAGTYVRRLEHTRANGIETLGLPATVEILQDLHDRPLRPGRIAAPDASWHFVLFLASDASSLLACAGVRQQHSEADPHARMSSPLSGRVDPAAP